jgi:hypothetical protein
MVDEQLANELRQHLSILQGQKGQDPSINIYVALSDVLPACIISPVLYLPEYRNR